VKFADVDLSINYPSLLQLLNPRRWWTMFKDSKLKITKKRKSRKPWFSSNAVILAKMPWCYCLLRFYNNFSFLININGVILTPIFFTFATAAKVRMICYLLAHFYLTVTSLEKFVLLMLRSHKILQMKTSHTCNDGRQC